MNGSFSVLFPYQVTPTLEVLFDFVDSWDVGSITIPDFPVIGTFFDPFRAKFGPDSYWHYKLLMINAQNRSLTLNNTLYTSLGLSTTHNFLNFSFPFP